MTPGYKHITWSVEVGSNGISAFNGANCARDVRGGLSNLPGVSVLERGATSSDNRDGSNPWARINRHGFVVTTGRSMVDVYVNVTQATEDYQIHLAAATAMKAAFGAFGAQWSASEIARKFNSTIPGAPSGSNIFSSWRSNGIGFCVARVEDYRPEAGTPPPIGLAIGESAADREQPPSAIGDTIAETFRNLADKLPKGNLIPTEYKVIAGIAVAIAGIAVIGYSARGIYNLVTAVK